jgi:hypothetical protein
MNQNTFEKDFSKNGYTINKIVLHCNKHKIYKIDVRKNTCKFDRKRLY